MADGVKVNIQGLTELNSQLEKLGKSLGQEPVEPVLYSGAKIISNEVSRRAPVYRGVLKSAVVTKKLRRVDQNPAPSIAAIDRRIAPHAHLPEYGTVKMSARPYFRPAVDSKAKEVSNHVQNNLKRLLDQAVR